MQFFVACSRTPHHSRQKRNVIFPAPSSSCAAGGLDMITVGSVVMSVNVVRFRFLLKIGGWVSVLYWRSIKNKMECGLVRNLKRSAIVDWLARGTKRD